jgi:two-component system, NtrC family, nitrogen regulation response regulator GlnG
MVTRDDPRPSMLSNTTLDPEVERAAPDDAPVTLLTILSHPDSRRVGEAAVLEAMDRGRFTALSRAELRFSPRGATGGECLADPFLSRRVVSFSRANGRVVVVAEPGGSALAINGVAVTREAFELPETSLDEGAVIELGGRVALVLHRASRWSRAPEARHGLVGENDAIERVRGEISRVADLDVPVLVRGETGTGKELVAQAIHSASLRARGPCVSVNMATVAETVAAAELFGHARGAFTGAVRDAPGYFARADGGTLFLDEIGEAPAAVQPMLLRALETGEVQPVGASTSRRVDVRVVAATDADLEGAVQGGRFGAALLHRLAGFEVSLPPLRHRRDDIGRLFVHFLRHELEALGERAKLDAAPAAKPFVPASLVASLARYAWPGNVRQLRNVVRQLVIGSRGEPQLQLGPSVERLLTQPAAPPASRETPAPAPARRKPSEIDDAALVAALRANGWRREPTARSLGVAVSTLYLLIDRCPLLRKAHELSRDELTRCRDACGGDLDKMSAALEVSTRALTLRMRELGIG